VILPRVNQHKAQGVGQHACVVDQLQGSVQQFILRLDVQQPHEL
jgi:hypothetical protein